MLHPILNMILFAVVGIGLDMLRRELVRRGILPVDEAPWAHVRVVEVAKGADGKVSKVGEAVDLRVPFIPKEGDLIALRGGDGEARSMRVASVGVETCKDGERPPSPSVSLVVIEDAEGEANGPGDPEA